MSVFDVVTAESAGAASEAPPSISETIASSNLLGVDYQI